MACQNHIASSSILSSKMVKSSNKASNMIHSLQSLQLKLTSPVGKVVSGQMMMYSPSAPHYIYSLYFHHGIEVKGGLACLASQATMFKEKHWPECI